MTHAASPQARVGQHPLPHTALPARPRLGAYALLPACLLPGTLPQASLLSRSLRASSLFPTDVPATPGAEEAQEAAREELTRGIYEHHDNLLSLIVSWLQDLMTKVPGATVLPSWLIVTILVLLLLALIIFLAVLVPAVWRARIRSKKQALFEDHRSAAELLQQANAAAEAGDYVTAVVERFRAVIRRLDEYGLLEDYPGMTAHEAAQSASQALGTLQRECIDAGILFDSVRYGTLASSPSQDEWMRGFAAAVDSALAHRTGMATAPTRPAAHPLGSPEGGARA